MLRSLAAALVLSGLVASCIVADAAKPTRKYEYSDAYYDNLSVKGPGSCVFPPRPVYRGVPQCEYTNPLQFDAERAAKLGPYLAPTVYMHPLDWSYMEDPVKWMMHDTNTTVYGHVWQTMNLTTVEKDSAYYTVVGPRSTVVNMWRDRVRMIGEKGEKKKRSSAFAPLTTEQIKERGRGAPIVDGLSTAKSYFTVAPAARWNASQQGLVKFTFWYFFPFNGCSNQYFALSMDGRFQGMEYVMCSPGVHEGDWEHISLLLCAKDVDELVEALEAPNVTVTATDAAQKIKSAIYGAHSWWSEYDCTKDECNDFFESDAKGQQRLAAYSGLFSHAMYPYKSNLIVYQKISIQLVVNMEGLYISDRTSNKGPKFVPTVENTLWLPLEDQMTQAQEEEFVWASFPGSWGGSYVGTNSTTITCLDLKSNPQRVVDCDVRNPAYYFLIWGMDIASMTGLVGDWRAKHSDKYLEWECKLDTTTVAKAWGLTGPLMRPQAYMHINPEMGTPLIWKGEGPDFRPTCPFSGDASDSNTAVVSFEQIDLPTFLSALVGIGVGCGVLFTVMACVLRLDDEGAIAIGATSISEQRECEKLQRMAGAEPGHKSMPVPTAWRAGSNESNGPEDAHPLSAPAIICVPSLAAGATGAPTQGSRRVSGQAVSEACLGGAPASLTEVDVTTAGAGAGAGGQPCSRAASKRAQGGGDAPAGADEEKGVPGESCVAASGGSKEDARLWREGEAGQDDESDPIHEYNMLRHVGWQLTAVAVYITAIVLTVLGIIEAFKAFRRVIDLWIWDPLEGGLQAVVLFFGVWQVLMMIFAILLRNQKRIALLCVKWNNPCGNASKASTIGRNLQAVQAGLLVVQINITMILFAFGFAMWVARLGIQSACNFAVTKLLYDLVDGNIQDVCIDLRNIVGPLDRIICGSDLANLCGMWHDLRLDFICYGCLLFVLAHMMWAAVTLHQYHSLSWMARLVRARLKMRKGAKGWADPAGVYSPLRPAKQV